MAAADVTFELDDVDGNKHSGAPSGPLVKPFSGPTPFEVSLTSYPMQPWTNRNASLNQWFNYGLNPSTWTRYAIQQMALYAGQENK